MSTVILYHTRGLDLQKSIHPMAAISDFMRIRGSSMRHTGALDVAVVGSTAEALLCASSISQLDIVTVKVLSRYAACDAPHSYITSLVCASKTFHG